MKLYFYRDKATDGIKLLFQQIFIVLFNHTDGHYVLDKEKYVRVRPTENVECVRLCLYVIRSLQPVIDRSASCVIG